MKIDQLKAGVVLSYVSMFLGYEISITYNTLMLRLLGQSEYGLHNLASSVVSYLGLLSFGFGGTYIRFYSRYKVRDDRGSIAELNGMFLVVFSIIGIIAALAGSVMVTNTERILGHNLSDMELNTAKILMAIMVFNLATSFPASVFNSYITANERYVFQKLIQMIKVVVNQFLLLTVLLMGYGSVGMVMVSTMLTLIVEVCNAVFCFRKLGMEFSFRRFDLPLMKEMTVFSSYIFMNMIIDQINWSLDKFLLGRYRGTVAVATYGLAAQLNTYYMSLSTTISSVFIPRVNRMVATENDNAQLTRLMTLVGRLQFMVLGLIGTGFAFFGKQFIQMWAGASYSDSYPIALLLIIPVTIPLVQNLGIEIQRAKNMHQFRSWVYLFIALFNLTLSIPLIKRFGGVGGALGTAIALIIGTGLIMNWYYHFRIGLDMKHFWLQIAKLGRAFIIPVTVGLLLVLFLEISSLVWFLLAGFLYTVAFALSMWFVGMNQYERELVSRPFKRIAARLHCDRKHA